MYKHASKVVVGAAIVILMIVCLAVVEYGMGTEARLVILEQQYHRLFGAPTNPQESASLLDTRQPVLASQDDRIEELENRVNKLETLAFAPRDAKGRMVLSTSGIALLSSEVGSMDRFFSNWNSNSRAYQESIAIDDPKMRLVVPYDTSWGNDLIGVLPFEVGGGEEHSSNVILFGPVTLSEMLGTSRWYGFRDVSRRTIEQALQDSGSVTEDETAEESDGCSGPSRKATKEKDIVKIGPNTALRLRFSHCEGGSISFEVFGARANYLFYSDPYLEESGLRWTIERFRER